MDSGFGDEEGYNVYDKPWRQDSTIANSIYRPSKNTDNDLYGDDLDQLIKTNRYPCHSDVSKGSWLYSVCVSLSIVLKLLCYKKFVDNVAQIGIAFMALVSAV